MKEDRLARSFDLSFRYTDNVLPFNSPFDNFIHRIYRTRDKWYYRQYEVSIIYWPTLRDWWKRKTINQTNRQTWWLFMQNCQLSFHLWQHPFSTCVWSFHITNHKLSEFAVTTQIFVPRYSSRLLTIRPHEQGYLATSHHYRSFMVVIMISLFVMVYSSEPICSTCHNFPFLFRLPRT